MHRQVYLCNSCRACMYLGLLLCHSMLTEQHVYRWWRQVPQARPVHQPPQAAPWQQWTWCCQDFWPANHQVYPPDGHQALRPLRGPHPSSQGPLILPPWKGPWGVVPGAWHHHCWTGVLDWRVKGECDFKTQSMILSTFWI